VAGEPVASSEDLEAYTKGIPLHYNGKDYYLLARDLTPPS